MVGADGGVFAFGDARFESSCPSIGGCVGAAVAVMPDDSGNGYWVVTTTGAVYSSEMLSSSEHLGIREQSPPQFGRQMGRATGFSSPTV